MSTRNICKRPLFFSLCALALSARGEHALLLAWRLNLSKSSRAYRGQSVTCTHTPHVHWLVADSLHKIATTLQQRASSSCPTGTHTHRAHPAEDAHLPNCLNNVCRPTVCTLDHRGLSVLRLHPTCTYAVSPASCWSSSLSRLQPDTVVHSPSCATLSFFLLQAPPPRWQLRSFLARNVLRMLTATTLYVLLALQHVDATH